MERYHRDAPSVEDLVEGCGDFLHALDPALGQRALDVLGVAHQQHSPLHLIRRAHPVPRRLRISSSATMSWATTSVRRPLIDGWRRVPLSVTSV